MVPLFFKGDDMKKKIAWILTCTLICNLFLCSMLSVPVLALSAGGLQSTIASIIISLMLQAGVAPVNNAWLAQLNNAYGVESSIGTIADCIESGLLTQTAEGLVDSGLSQAIASESAYTSLGLSDIFTTTVDDAGVIAGSGAVNLANSAINVGTVGTVGAYAGAVAVGVGVGVLIDHARQALLNFIRSGAKMDLNYNEIKNCPEGKHVVISSYGRSGYAHYQVFYCFADDKSEVCAYPISPYRYVLVGVNPEKNDYASFRLVRGDNGNLIYSGVQQIQKSPADLGQLDGGVGNWGAPYTNVKIFSDKSQCDNYLNSYKADPAARVYPVSPDLIGPEGNHRAVNDDGDVTYPGFVNMVPEGYDMQPVDMDDYMDYVDEANQNTEDGDTDETQAVMFDNFVNQYLVQDESGQPVIPDEPSVPDRPIIPDQPEIGEKPSVTPSDQAEALEGATTVELRSVFPFCIPFDIFDALKNLKYEGREAPVIVFEFPDTAFTSSDWGIVIDLSEYDEVAEILRKMELLLFIIGLAVETRKLIGAT